MKNTQATITILDYNTKPWVVKHGLKFTKKVLEVTSQLNINLMLCPPISHLSEFMNEFDLPIISKILSLPNNTNEPSLLTAQLLKEMNIFGVIVNQSIFESNIDTIERKIREARYHRLQTIAFSNNVAITAALCKLDPHMIVFTPYYDNISRQELDSTKTQLIAENHIKRINIENPRVKKVLRSTVNQEIEKTKLISLGLDGTLLDADNLWEKTEKELLQIFKQICP